MNSECVVIFITEYAGMTQTLVSCPRDCLLVCFSKLISSPFHELVRLSMLLTILGFRQKTSVLSFYQFVGTMLLQLLIELQHNRHLRHINTSLICHCRIITIIINNNNNNSGIKQKLGRRISAVRFRFRFTPKRGRAVNTAP